MTRVVGAWLTSLALASLAGWLGVQVDRRAGGFRAQEEVLYFTSGEQLAALAPGFEALLADVYWLRTVQYFGHAVLRREGGAEARALATLIEITTTLDPQFRVAYLGGAAFLAEPPPVGPGDGQAAVRLLEKAALALPSDWIVHQHLGFTIYLNLGDAERASARLTAASRLPGAPFWLETFAASLLAEGGVREKSRTLWRKIYEESELEPLRINAKYNLQRLDALDELDGANARSAAFRAKHGRLPRTPGELAAVWQGRPAVDPTGRPYAYDAASGSFSIAPGSMIYRSEFPFSSAARPARR